MPSYDVLLFSPAITVNALMKNLLQTLHMSNAKDCRPTFHQHKNQKWTI